MTGHYLLDQDWGAYDATDHAVWRRLFDAQSRLLPGRADAPFLDGLARIAGDGARIPRFEDANRLLKPATGFELVAVNGLVPDQVFFALLAERRFPVTRWIRRPAQLDYIQEPDLFHDFFGHVPLLGLPVFADFMQAYGAAGRAAGAAGALRHLARLYWYTVEFGLIETDAGLRIYGAGIVSSKGETVFSLDDPSPNRIGFDRARVMATDYRIDDYQQTYFVIDGYETLFHALDGDLAPVYAALANRPALAPDAVVQGDRVRARGTQAYARAKHAA